MGCLLDRIAQRWATGDQTVALLDPLGQVALELDPVLAVRHGNDSG